MQRILLFWRALPLGAKLQQLVIVLILSYNFIALDLNPNNRFLGHPLWWTTLPIILLMIVVSRLLLPLMMQNPTRTQQFLHALGLIVFGLWIVGRTQWWGRLIVTYLGIIGGFWFEAAASFWFVSEIQRRNELSIQEFTKLMEDQNSSSNDSLEDDSHDDDSSSETERIRR